MRHVYEKARERAREVRPSPGERAGLDRCVQIKAFEDVEQDVIRERADRIFILVLLNKPLARMTSEYNCSIVSERQGEGSARGLGTNVFSSDIGVCFDIQ